MSVGIGIIGREVTMTVGGQTILGVTEKGFTFNNEPLVTTDDASSGWQEHLAKPGRKSVELSLSGMVKNLELVKAYFQASQIFEVVATYPDGSTITLDMSLSSLNPSGAENELVTFDATFASSGAPAFVAGV